MGLIVNGRMRFLGKFEGVFPQLPPPIPSFTASPTTGLVPLTVQFTNTTTATAVSYEWDFTGDGVVDSTDVNPSYTYVNTGTYNVSLTIVNTGGRITTTASNYIVAYTIPPASLSGTSINSVGLRIAVYDDNSLIGDGIDLVPLTFSFTNTSETLLGTSNNNVPLTASNDNTSAQTVTTDNIYSVPLTMTNYVHS